MEQTILLVEDDLNTIETNKEALSDAGYRVLEAHTVSQAQNCIALEFPALIIIPTILPDGNGIELCRSIRKKSNAFILFLADDNKARAHIESLQAGGDDYLTKPCHPSILLAHIDVLFRRSIDKEQIVCGPLRLDSCALQAFLNDTDMLLSQKEFLILSLLIKNRGMVIDKETLYLKAWGRPIEGDSNALKVTLSRLRRKIESVGLEIESVRHRGYVFIASDL